MLHGINYLQTIYKYTVIKLYTLKYRKKVCKLNSPDSTRGLLAKILSYCEPVMNQLCH